MAAGALSAAVPFTVGPRFRIRLLHRREFCELSVPHGALPAAWRLPSAVPAIGVGGALLFFGDDHAGSRSKRGVVT